MKTYQKQQIIKVVNNYLERKGENLFNIIEKVVDNTTDRLNLVNNTKLKNEVLEVVITTLPKDSINVSNVETVCLAVLGGNIQDLDKGGWF